MRAMAIVRETSYESAEEQRLSIAAYAQFEGIDVTHSYQLLEDSYNNVYEELSKVDAIIITTVSMISKEIQTLDDFKSVLNKNNIRLISMFS